VTSFECDGATLWYQSLGEGDLMIVLHGGLGLDHSCYRPWLDPLGDELALTYLDFRANGRSTGDGDDLTMGLLAEDVDALREHLGHEQTWLLGHSYGGFVALEYALRFPARVRGLVLMDTDSKGPRPEIMMAGLQELGATQEQVAAFATPVASTEEMLALFDTAGPLYLPHSDATMARRVMGRTIYRKGGSDGGGRALAGWDVTARLPEIGARALVLTGADDFMFPPVVAHALGDSLPDATVAIIDGSGHMPFVEATEVTLETVRDFVRRG
jgi:proline iminopeptidase